ncbi:MAG: hypothetical protein E7309_07870 [Butyrivibrio sp.]|nr:hypothetical protein [Butyrivibrio sp.]
MLKKKKTVYIITIIFSAIALLFAIVFFFDYKAMASYVEVPAYVSDITTTWELKGRVRSTVYNYTINYTYEGSTHQYYVKKSTSCPRLSSVWIDPKTFDVSVQSRGAMLFGSFFFFSMSVICMGSTILFYKKIDKK